MGSTPITGIKNCPLTVSRSGGCFLFLVLRGANRATAPHCARRRVSEANRRKAAALRPEMCQNQQSSGLLVSPRETSITGIPYT